MITLDTSTFKFITSFKDFFPPCIKANEDLNYKTELLKKFLKESPTKYKFRIIQLHS